MAKKNQTVKPVEIEEVPVEVVAEVPVSEPSEPEVQEVQTKTKEPKPGDFYLHNILGTKTSKWEVRRKTENGSKLIGKYAPEKAVEVFKKYAGDDKVIEMY